MRFLDFIEPILDIFLQENIVSATVYNAWKNEFKKQESLTKATKSQTKKFFESTLQVIKQTNKIDVTSFIRVQQKDLREKRLNSAKIKFTPYSPCMHIQMASANFNHLTSEPKVPIVFLKTSKKNKTCHLSRSVSRVRQRNRLAEAESKSLTRNTSPASNNSYHLSRFELIRSKCHTASTKNSPLQSNSFFKVQKLVIFLLQKNQDIWIYLRYFHIKISTNMNQKI